MPWNKGSVVEVRKKKNGKGRFPRRGHNYLWYHLLHKAVKYGARLFRSIPEEEAVRKIFTSIYTEWPLFPIFLRCCSIRSHMYTHASLLHNRRDSFTLAKTLFLPPSSPFDCLLLFLANLCRPLPSFTCLAFSRPSEISDCFRVSFSLWRYTTRRILHMSHFKVLFRAAYKGQVNRIALRLLERTQNGPANRIDYKYRPGQHFSTW